MINRWSKRLTRDAAALVSPFRSSGGEERTISAVSDSNLPAFEQADRPVQSDWRSRIAPVTSGKRRREGVRRPFPVSVMSRPERPSCMATDAPQTLGDRFWLRHSNSQERVGARLIELPRYVLIRRRDAGVDRCV